jgi:hypothetical protein
MIYYLVTDRFRRTAVALGALPGLRGRFRILTYEELFFERAGPIGHYVFTDLDRISRYETENLERFARALLAVASDARILNRPTAFLDRVPLLLALARAGINDFSVIRLDTGERPKRYPVFLRTEDGHLGPEGDLLRDDEAFDAALAALAREGKPRRGRIAVGFAGEKGPDGLYRKYGAFIVGDRVIADELFISDRWAVKDAVAIREPAQIAEELRYARENPHAELLRPVFALAGIDYGRADYAFVDGRLQVYEVNTNPKVPQYDLRDERTERRVMVGKTIAETLLALDAVPLPRGRVRFAEVRPGAHDRRVPRRRLPSSLLRRLTDAFTARPKNSS